jgi:hypothetical protein
VGLSTDYHAVWHAHPVGYTVSSLGGHDENASQIMPTAGAPYTIFTTLSDYNSQNELVETLYGQTYYHIPAPTDDPVDPYIVR